MTKARTFRFRQFEIIHQQSAMKVGTDGVLLGAWMDISNAKRVLDVGTGSGMIALMAAQKNESAIIDAIDNEESAVKEAQLNIMYSPWSDRVHAFCESFQNYDPGYFYDHIVSNPPFFVAGSASPIENRHNARHTNTLDFEALIKNAARLLNGSGSLSIIVPAIEGAKLIELGAVHGLFLIQQASFISKPNRKPVRLLLCFSKIKHQYHEDEIVHYNEDNSWSAQYRELTKDFYIK
jgi:tRNA1Val (adenine37-N6)-methyltransferase